jgi:hypothetical protein
MGKTYSLDFRKRVVAAIEGGMSRNQAARRGVAISTAIGWMKRVDETGSVAPGPDGQSRAEGDFGGPGDLAVAADQGRRFHHMRARCRACQTRPEGRLPLGAGLRARRET